jgi:hypothetical protein
MSGQAYLYKTSGEIVPVLPVNGTSFTLGELSSFVNGYVQIVTLKDGRLMIMNEEGKIDGLEQNDTATNLAKSVLFHGDYVVGDVLVTPYAFVN